VGVDHRGLQLRVAEQLLHGPDVAAVDEQVAGEAVAQAVEGRSGASPCPVYDSGGDGPSPA
jgi:hypothetical protein